MGDVVCGLVFCQITTKGAACYIIELSRIIGNSTNMLEDTTTDHDRGNMIFWSVTQYESSLPLYEPGMFLSVFE